MFNAESTTLRGYDFRLTSVAFPEQYDVYKDGLQVAYVRLRHGSLTVDVPDVGGREVLHAHPEGDACFEDHERPAYLNRIVDAIEAHMALHSA